MKAGGEGNVSKMSSVSAAAGGCTAKDRAKPKELSEVSLQERQQISIKSVNFNERRQISIKSVNLNEQQQIPYNRRRMSPPLLQAAGFIYALKGEI